MARDYDATGTDIWTEATVTSLKRDEQRAWWLLKSQPELSRCGVLPFTLRRWATLAADDSPKKLRASIAGLERGRVLVVDEDSEEVLLRTYVRHDGLLKQPQVVGAMVRDWRSVRSPRLRIEVLAELRRIWHLQISGEERRGLRIALGLTENEKQQQAVGAGLAVPMAEAITAGLVEPFEQGSVQGLPEGLGKALARLSTPLRTPLRTPAPSVVQREEEVEVELRAGEPTPEQLERIAAQLAERQRSA